MVDLPDPFAPRMAVKLPRSMAKEMSLSRRLAVVADAQILESDQGGIHIVSYSFKRAARNLSGPPAWLRRLFPLYGGYQGIDDIVHHPDVRVRIAARLPA